MTSLPVAAQVDRAGAKTTAAGLSSAESRLTMEVGRRRRRLGQLQTFLAIVKIIVENSQRKLPNVVPEVFFDRSSQGRYTISSIPHSNVVITLHVMPKIISVHADGIDKLLPLPRVSVKACTEDVNTLTNN